MPERQSLLATSCCQVRPSKPPLQDLLRPESENLQIRENEAGVFVGGVHQQV